MEVHYYDKQYISKTLFYYIVKVLKKEENNKEKDGEFGCGQFIDT